MFIHGLPGAESWPGLIPKPSRTELLRRDAATLCSKHRGDITALVSDPDLNIRLCTPATVRELRRDLAYGGMDIPSGAQPNGYVGFRFDGGHDVYLSDELDADALARVLVHEVGHIRGDMLFDDRSEAAAEAWAD